jgi:endopolyphosphatase
LRPAIGVKSGRRSLKGRFLHITDVHPDPYYKVHSSTDEDAACHRGHGPAGVYGAETSGCDSPVSLLNQTFAWIKEHLRDEVDFVIWTGDSARHDNDERLPRSEKQVIGENELLVSKFVEAFGKPETSKDDDPTNDFIVPIVPTLGNNDVLPHNIFTKGPNRWTKRFLDVWRQFIPEEQRHQFVRGGWFYTEVIPGHLAVFSLNTLYFFDSNSAVDGCAAKHEPGFEQFEWLRIQLDILRSRGMKALLTGHVPPARVENKMSWDETCWQKYTLWIQQYRDVIVGSFYGHMNIDHFMLQDFEDVKKHVRNGQGYVNLQGQEDEKEQGKRNIANEDVSIASAGDYLVGLRDDFAKIPHVKLFSDNSKDKKKSSLDKIGGQDGERYSLSFVSASVVPNYFPSLRVFSYNVTGLEDNQSSTGVSASVPASHHWDLRSLILDRSIPGPLDDHDLVDQFSGGASNKEEKKRKKKKEEKKKKKKKKPRKRLKFRVPPPPSSTAPPGPAYSPQALSLLGYVQYYANLTLINNDFSNAEKREQKPEMDNLGPRVCEIDKEQPLLDDQRDINAGKDGVELNRWKPGKHNGESPQHQTPHPKKFKFQVEYNTSAEGDVYRLPDLSVMSYLELARRIVESMEGGKRSVDAAFEDGGGDAQAQKKKGTKKHGKNKKKKKKKKEETKNKVWFAFVRRAFVGTMDVSDIEDQFGQGDEFP